MDNDPNQPPSEQRQAPLGQPAQYGEQPPQEQPTQYGGSPPMNQQPRRSRRGLWITLGIIGGVLLLGIAGCILAFVFIFNNSPAKTVTQQYYDAIKDQDYNKAYSYIDPTNLTIGGQPMTQNLYTLAAKARDSAKGTVSSYSITGIDLNSSSSAGNTARVTVNVTRGQGASYDVQIDLKQEGNNWKIVRINDI